MALHMPCLLTDACKRPSSAERAGDAAHAQHEPAASRVRGAHDQGNSAGGADELFNFLVRFVLVYEGHMIKATVLEVRPVAVLGLVWFGVVWATLLLQIHGHIPVAEVGKGRTAPAAAWRGTFMSQA